MRLASWNQTHECMGVQLYIEPLGLQLITAIRVMYRTIVPVQPGQGKVNSIQNLLMLSVQ